ncbi:butyrophilin subfamily 3 member A2-like [Girardinichthys multiradiatus]|uniref:butyrophilin subfamily 3 member A2-like n=1 Tax=Girardinichthys multiradiatus TaxID=208333 RepID=UPI001FAE15C9|nr:butyrophilin subfamily 3 member A2-like [Girardinichthys multiradiatus]
MAHKRGMSSENLLSNIAVSGFLLLMSACKGHLQQMDSSQSVTAMVGEDVVLPCHLEPPKDASQMTVEWGRLDLEPRFVFVSLDGQAYPADQNEAYKGRSSMFPDKLKNGDISLKLSDVRHSDNGRYRCYIPNEEKEYFVDLVVGSASSPDISIAGLDASNSGVMLDCSSAGWYPEADIFWLDGEGNIMSAGPADKIRGPDGLYRVSSRVTVEKRHNNNVTCRVQQKDINQTRETHIYVQDGSFIPPPDCSVSISFSVMLGLTLLLGAVTFIWLRQQTKISIKKLKDKVNEEQQQLMAEEKQNLAQKKSKLEEEIQNRNKDQRSIDQQIEAFTKMSAELKEQKIKLAGQIEEAEKMVEEDERKLKAVDDEVRNQTGNKAENRAQRYLKLKVLITDSNDRLDKIKKGNQHVELMTEKLMGRTCDEVTKLNERKQEIENHLEEKQKQLKEIDTDGISLLRKK